MELLKHPFKTKINDIVKFTDNVDEYNNEQLMLSRVGIHKIYYEFKRGKNDIWNKDQIIDFNQRILNQYKKRKLKIDLFGELDILQRVEK